MLKDRVQFVDIMRGIAMLLVVLGHTMTGCTVGAERSFLFNIVWSLQMPLFILISGYVTRYSRDIDSSATLLKYVKVRTKSYLLPWAVWSFLVRGIIFSQHNFLDIKWNLWHMDSGYWFLITIWTINIIFGVSCFVARKIAKEPGIKRQIATLAVYIFGMAILTGIGLVAGLSFFSIKLTLYYMPFYFAGYLYGQYADKISEAKWGKTAIDATVAVCLAVWLLVMTRYDLYALPDRGMGIILRVVSSMAGCTVVCGLCKNIFCYVSDKKAQIATSTCWCGEHSLEIYLTHYLLLNLLKMMEMPITGSIQGAALIAINFLITVGMTTFTVKILSTNRILRLILFATKV